MAKITITNKIESVKKKTRSSGKAIMVKTSSMNKSKKRTYKKYRGQAR